MEIALKQKEVRDKITPREGTSDSTRHVAHLVKSSHSRSGSAAKGMDSTTMMDMATRQQSIAQMFKNA